MWDTFLGSYNSDIEDYSQCCQDRYCFEYRVLYQESIRKEAGQILMKIQMDLRRKVDRLMDEINPQIPMIESDSDQSSISSSSDNQYGAAT